MVWRARRKGEREVTRGQFQKGRAGPNGRSGVRPRGGPASRGKYRTKGQTEERARDREIKKQKDFGQQKPSPREFAVTLTAGESLEPGAWATRRTVHPGLSASFRQHLHRPNSMENLSQVKSVFSVSPISIKNIGKVSIPAFDRSPHRLNR